MRVLVIKLGAIGDVIQTAAAVRISLEDRLFDHIDWVCGEQVAPLVKGFRLAEKIIVVNENRLFGKGIGRFIYAFKIMLKLASLGGGAYDLVVIPQNDVRYRFLSAFVKARKKISFRRSSKDQVVLAQRNRIYGSYRLLGGSNKKLDLPKVLQSLGENLFSENMALPFDLPDIFIALCPGGARNFLRSDDLRRWPIEHYILLAERLIKEGKHVVLLGGKGDDWVNPYFKTLPLTNLIGKTDLVQMIKVLSLAEVVVTHDSGPLHMATLTKAGLVALFGPTPANAIVPFGRKRTVVLREENQVACSPCYDGCNYAECNEAICMQHLSVDAVAAAVRRLAG